MTASDRGVIGNVSMPVGMNFRARRPARDRSIQQRRSNAAITYSSSCHVDRSWSRHMIQGSRCHLDHRRHVDGGRNRRGRHHSVCDHVKVMTWAAGDDSCDREDAPCYSFWYTALSVEEMARTSKFSITGTIPECLSGHFVRNGPIPKFPPIGEYRW